MTVVGRARRPSCASGRVSPEVAESRLPVGSSAKTTVGWETRSARYGDALLLSTRQLTRPVRAAIRRPHLLQEILEPRLVRLRAGDRQRQANVLLRAQHGEEVEELEDEPDVLAPELVRSVSPSVVTSVPSMATVPDVGLSSPARMCISVDLPEPNGPMTAVSLPRSTSRLTPRSASTAVSPPVAPRHVAGATTAAPLLWRTFSSDRASDGFMSTSASLGDVRPRLSSATYSASARG